MCGGNAGSRRGAPASAPSAVGAAHALVPAEAGRDRSAPPGASSGTDIMSPGIPSATIDGGRLMRSRVGWCRRRSVADDAVVERAAEDPVRVSTMYEITEIAELRVEARDRVVVQ